ncbi:MAG: ABC transporter permease [Desulfuromonadales bacterium]|nr:ABC transporter permease [Desulfuromonadales bacterium]
MKLAAMIIRNQLFYRRKVLPVVLLCGLIIFLPLATQLFVDRIKVLADRPLQSLDTEFILQNESTGKPAEQIATRGLIQPFNLNPIKREQLQQLQSLDGIRNFSTALVLWQLDVKSNLVVVALQPQEPLTGLRKIETFLMPGSVFFSRSDAAEAILERHFAKLFGYKKGATINVSGEPVTIVGIVDFKEQSNLSSAQVFIPYDTGLRLAGASEPVVNQVYIALASSADAQSLSRQIGNLFPDHALIARDTLFKNLSGFNQLVYAGGDYLALVVSLLAVLLLCWVLKLYALEFAEQKVLLRTIGWATGLTRRWVLFDLGLILLLGALLAGILSALFFWQILPMVDAPALLDQGLKL